MRKLDIDKLLKKINDELNLFRNDKIKDFYFIVNVLNDNIETSFSTISPVSFTDYEINEFNILTRRVDRISTFSRIANDEECDKNILNIFIKAIEEYNILLECEEQEINKAKIMNASIEELKEKLLVLKL